MIGPILGAGILYAVLNFTDIVLRRAVNADYIPASIMSGTQVGQVRFMLIGLALLRSGILTGARSRSFYALMAATGYLVGGAIIIPAVLLATRVEIPRRPVLLAAAARRRVPLRQRAQRLRAAQAK